MGGGKGAPELWVAVIEAGSDHVRDLGVSEALAKEAMRLAQHKLPVKTKFVKREEMGGEADES